jgi:thiol-disulfide isomerase/thioredoxin
MNKNILIILIVLVSVAGGVYFGTSKKEDIKLTDQQKDIQSDKMLAKENPAMAEKEAEGDKDSIAKVGSYEVYASEKVALASTTHHVVLFFRAGWCPTCKALDDDIKANLSKIPSSLTILDVNYDDSTALKIKYGVTYQHTFVQVDKDGKLIKKWSGSPTLSALVAEIK